MSKTKQVIVMRKDLNMRKGKMCAQAAHASMSFLTKEARIEHMDYGAGWCNYSLINDSSTVNNWRVSIEEWLNNSFRKICVYVNSEEELLDVYNKAKEHGCIAHIIEDNGATEFNGIKTLTCCAIGPHDEEIFFDLTDHLPLL